jgi:hypothetical protein
VRQAKRRDVIFAAQIIEEMESSAKLRGSGISKRSSEQIIEKIDNGKAVIALTNHGEWVGFSYFDSWEDGKFVSNSGLIVSPSHRNQGVASCIKNKIFKLSRRKYPQAMVFSITSGSAIMKMNTRLGFQPVTYDEIVRAEDFWMGCKSCVNYDVLQSKGTHNCLCTAMLFNPSPH